VKDEEVLSMGGVDTHLPVEVGTILTMDVKGQKASGAALLSARSVARRNAWNRVQQVCQTLNPFHFSRFSSLRWKSLIISGILIFLFTTPMCAWVSE